MLRATQIAIPACESRCCADTLAVPRKPSTSLKLEQNVPETTQQSQPPQQFQPFVPATESRPELTFRALLLGSLFGILFGAVTVYVGLRAGLTVAASIPISVLSISVLRALGRASILENNIVQTTGNAGQSIA
jgi:hypothetical protein